MDLKLKCTLDMQEKRWKDPTIEDQVRFPQYFDKMEATATLENGTETQAEMTLASKPLKESEKATMSREDACYNIIDETQSVM
jgi:hypothetical protein